MANTVTSTTVFDGDKLLLVKVDILGDGTGEETAKIIVDASTYSPAFTDCAIDAVHAQLNGFTARLLFDATTDVPALSLSDFESHYSKVELASFMPINNNAGTGKTGDILMTTVGLGPNDHGTILLRIIKKY